MSPQLDPQAEALLEVMRAVAAPPVHTLSVDAARAQMRATLMTKGEPIALHSVEDIALPAPHGALAMRLFRPAGGSLPVALFLHGGGWTLNDLDTHDHLCRRIARRSGWLIAALDYRRAPEHPHPAALEDAYYAYRWLIDNAERIGSNASRSALVGESSGGTTAACLTSLLRDIGAPLPGLQILAYPLADRCDRWPSYRERGTGYTLDRASLQWFVGNYVPAGGDLEDRYLYPLATSDFAGLAPTLIMTAEFDPLRDEGIAYAQKLSSAGVSVEHIHADDQMHGFLLLDRAIAKAGTLIDRLADALAAQASAETTLNSSTAG